MCQAKLLGASEAQSLPYLCVLGRLVRDCPGLMSSHLPCLKVRSQTRSSVLSLQTLPELLTFSEHQDENRDACSLTLNVKFHPCLRQL